MSTYLKRTRVLAAVMLLSIAMLFGLASTSQAYAEQAVKAGGVDQLLGDGQAAESVEVTFTLSNQGSLAADKDGGAVVNRPVTVADIDGDGKLTYDEALVAAHDAYYDGGAAAGYDPGSGFVDKLWGVSSTNTLFYINGEGLSTGVTVDTVKKGDALYASINADNVYWADWYTKFSETDIEVPSTEDVTVNLVGHLGMAYTEDEKQFVPLEGVQIGIWKNGAFEAIEGAVTDEDGNASFKLDAGEYILTAQGTVEGVVTDWNLIDLSYNQGWPRGIVSGDDWYVAYTDADYGDGPYPANEVKYIDFFEEADDDSDNEYAWQDLHYLKSNQIIADCPIMAPYAKLVVKQVNDLADGTYSATGLSTAVLSMYHFHDPLVVVKGDNAWLITTEDTDNTVTRFDGMAYGPQSKILDPSDTTNRTLVSGTPTAMVSPIYKADGVTLETRTFVLPVPKLVVASGTRIYYMIKYVAGYGKGHDDDWYKASGGDYYLTGYTLNQLSDATTLPVADYSAVRAAIAAAPTEQGDYTDASWKTLQDAIAAVVEGKEVTEQAEVDAMAKDINDASSSLEYLLSASKEEGLRQDIGETATISVSGKLTTTTASTSYSYAFVGGIADAPADPSVEGGGAVQLDQSSSPYTFSLTMPDLNGDFAVCYYSANKSEWYERKMTLNLAAKTLLLAKSVADYTAVDKAVASAPANQGNYTDASWQALQDAIAAVGNKDKLFSQQTEVDAMAQAITKAISELVTKVNKPTAKTGLIYSGSNLTGVVASTGYTISNGSAKNAGTYQAIAKLKPGFVWSDGTNADAKISFTIAKAANPLKIAKANRSLKFSKAKTKKGKAVAGAKVSAKGQGAVTYKITKVMLGKKKVKKYSKNFTINKKTGKITVKKLAKKGTYKVTVKAVAAGNANYNKSAAKTAVVTIKVK